MSEHDGHRARKKKLFREQGLDAFSDLEALELLLYFAVPRVDTTPLARRLLKRFGSLDLVLAASQAELMKTSGVGQNAAALIHLVLPLARRARAAADARPVILNSAEAIGDYFLELFLGMRQERLYQACLDAKGKLLRCDLVSEGAIDAVTLDLRRIVASAFQCNASAVILAHNHPSGVALPSPDDNQATLTAWDALHRIGIRLVDHIIVADGDFVSLRDNGLLPPD